MPNFVPLFVLLGTAWCSAWLNLDSFHWFLQNLQPFLMNNARFPCVFTNTALKDSLLPDNKNARDWPMGCVDFVQ